MNNFFERTCQLIGQDKVNNLSKRDYTIMKMSGIEKLAEIKQKNEVYI
jgi:hypothetical protein